jgi:hypothetical protein
MAVGVGVADRPWPQMNAALDSAAAIANKAKQRKCFDLFMICSPSMIDEYETALPFEWRIGAYRRPYRVAHLARTWNTRPESACNQRSDDVDYRSF